MGVRDLLDRSARDRLGSRAGAFWRERRRRVRAYLPPILQVALAAAIAWQLADWLLPTSQPVFAAVMAVNALGISIGKRGLLAVETVLGVTTGIGVASLALDLIGTGAVQLAVLTALAMVLAVLLGGGTTFAGQAGVWAILVATFRGPGSLYPEALLETLIGGVIALIFSQLLFPLDPASTSRRALGDVLRVLADGLRDGAAAIRDGDEERAARARLALLSVEGEIAGLREAVAMSTNTARLAPTRRGARPHVEAVGRLAPHLDLAGQDAGGLLAAIARLVRHQEDAPRLEEALARLAAGADQLAAGPEPGHVEAARRAALEAVAHAPDRFDPQSTPAALVCWSLVQSLTLHLLVAAGMDEDEARDAVARTAAAGGWRQGHVFGSVG